MLCEFLYSTLGWIHKSCETKKLVNSFSHTSSQIFFFDFFFDSPDVWIQPNEIGYMIQEHTITITKIAIQDATAAQVTCAKQILKNVLSIVAMNLLKGVNESKPCFNRHLDYHELNSVISRCISRIFLSLNFIIESPSLSSKHSFSSSTSISIRFAIIGVFAISIVNNKSEQEIPINDNINRIVW